MDSMANRISSAIVGKVKMESLTTVIRPVRIGVNLPRDSHFISCIWAVIKIGASYVPIDVTTPIQRRDYICEDSELDLLITEDNLPEFLSFSKPLPDDFTPLTYTPDPAFLPEAYMIYTSGTTGKPKGVSQTYRTLYSYMLTVSLPDNYNISERSIILQFASISFDVSVLEIFAGLFHGATQIVAQEEDKHNATQLYKLILKTKVSFTFLPPSLLAVFPDYEMPDMDCLSAGGEAIPHSLTEKIAGRYSYRFVNGYGPTESIVTTTHEILDADDWKNIGKPVPGVVCYVVDENLRLVSPGERGELLISGMQLTNGYWNRPDLNSEKFFNNPFEQTHDGIPVPRVYHSGDLVELNPDGSFNYLGRIDSQVKLHGFRIELSEVTTCIERVPGVLRAYVQLEEVGNDMHLVAYVNLSKSTSTTLADIQEYAKSQLTTAMVPTFWNVVDTFPLNVNGKIDKTRLTNSAFLDRLHNTTPLSGDETLLMATLANILGVKEIDVETDLISELGITSIQLMQVPMKLSMIGFNISVSDFYRYRSIRNVCANRDGRLAYWYNEPVGEQCNKPVLIFISGYASFAMAFAELAEAIKEKYAIYVVETHFQLAHNEIITFRELTDRYIELLRPICEKYNVAAMTGYCSGGEQALYLLHVLYKDKAAKPLAIVMEGQVRRDERTVIPLEFPFLTYEQNMHRNDIDLELIRTYPDFTYSGPVLILLAEELATQWTLDLEQQKKYLSTEVEKLIKDTFEATPSIWKQRYPDCEIILIPSDHKDFLLRPESLQNVVDAFLKQTI